MKYLDSFDSTLSDWWEVKILGDEECGSVDIDNGQLRMEITNFEIDDEKRAELHFLPFLGSLDAMVQLNDISVPLNDGFVFGGLCICDIRNKIIYGVGAATAGDGSPLDVRGITYNRIEKKFESVSLTPKLSYAAGQIFRIQRRKQWVDLSVIDNGNEFPIWRLDDFDGDDAFVYLMYSGEGNFPAEVTFSGFMLDYDAPSSRKIWDNLPPWLRSYPYEIETTGDLSMTPNGVICLLRDIADVLEMTPGELPDHAEIGAGIVEFLGAVNSTPELARLAGQIKAALKSKAIGARLIPERSKVQVRTIGSNELEVDVEITAMDGGKVVPLNFVYHYGIDDLSQIYSEAPIFAETSSATDDDYALSALGRDIKLARSRQ